MVTSTTTAFKQTAHVALADAGLQTALAFSRPLVQAKRAKAVAVLPEFVMLRGIGRDITNHTLANFDFYAGAGRARSATAARAADRA